MSLILSYLRESRSLRLQYLSCRSVQLLWHFSQTAVHLICFGRSLHPSHEAGLPPSPRLAGCPLRMHRGAGSRPSSACVDPCGDLWLLLQREQRLICQRVSLSPPGGSPGGARRVRCVGWHSWVLAQSTCPHLDGRPPTAVGRVSSPRGVAQCLAPKKNPISDFLLPL